MQSTKELINKVNNAFLENKMDVFMDMIADDIVWDMHSSTSGHTTMRGKNEVGDMDPGNMPEKMIFNFEKTIIEENVASVTGTGTGTTRDGQPYKGYFCDIYEFENDKIKKMTSYVIDHKG